MATMQEVLEYQIKRDYKRLDEGLRQLIGRLEKAHSELSPEALPSLFLDIYGGSLARDLSTLLTTAAQMATKQEVLGGLNNPED